MPIKPRPPEDTLSLSLPPEREVRGYAVRKLPLGAYLRAMQALCALPDTLLAALFPDRDASAALQSLRSLTPEAAVPLLTRALAAAPKPLFKALSLLSGVSENALMNDPALGADGLLELLNAVIEVNGLANFIPAARATLARLTTAAGCKP